MATIVPGFTTEQKTITVNNSDSDINTAITSEAADGWIVSSLTLSGAEVIILFMRTITAS